jgi:hypothetical protein
MFKYGFNEFKDVERISRTLEGAQCAVMHGANVYCVTSLHGTFYLVGNKASIQCFASEIGGTISKVKQ